MFSNTGRPITKSEIKTIELELGITFPNDFIEHYLVYNGGIPSLPFFYSETDIETEIQVFSPIKYKINNNIKTVEEKYAFFKERSMLMSEFLPFANDYGSNQICINLKSNNIYCLHGYRRIESKVF